MIINFILNQKEEEIDCPPEQRLSHLLRDKFEIKSIRQGCEKGRCGHCLVIMDHELIASCLIPVFLIKGKHIKTLELYQSKNSKYNQINRMTFEALEQSFAEAGLFLCSHCEASRKLSIIALLEKNSQPSGSEVEQQLSSIRCRCSGYSIMKRAVIRASEIRQQKLSALTDEEKRNNNIVLPGNSSGLSPSSDSFVINRKTLSPRIYTPKNLNGLLNMLAEEPEIKIFTGGTYLLRKQEGPFLHLPSRMATLENLEELQRISRTERHMEIGAATSISQIMETGKNILPPILSQAMEELGPPHIKNRATLGGNICVKDKRMDIFPVLHTLDTRLELRSHLDPKKGKRKNKSRWIPLNRFIRPDGTPDLSPGEILTRVRIPLEPWTLSVYKKLGRKYSYDYSQLTFCALAQTDKDVLAEIRLAFGLMNQKILRNKELEADLAGRKLPLSEKETRHILGSFKENASEWQNLPAFQQHRILSLTRWFLEEIAETMD